MTQLNIDGAAAKLSTHRNENAAYRMKTDYYPKPVLYLYDNRVPGPGTCKWLARQTGRNAVASRPSGRAR